MVHVEHVEGPGVCIPVQGMTPTYPDFELLAQGLTYKTVPSL